MNIDNKFEHFEEVTLKTDPNKDKRIVTSIRVLPNNGLIYDLSYGCTVSEHYDGEIERVKEQKTVKGFNK